MGAYFAGSTHSTVSARAPVPELGAKGARVNTLRALEHELRRAGRLAVGVIRRRQHHRARLTAELRMLAPPTA